MNNQLGKCGNSVKTGLGLVPSPAVLIREEFSSSCKYRFLSRVLETHLREWKNSSCSVQDISTELQQQEKFSLCSSTACLSPTNPVLGRAQKQFFEDTTKAAL